MHFILIVVVLLATEHKFRTNTLPRSRPKAKQTTLLLLLFASTKFCDFGIPTILRVLFFAISRSRAKFAISRNRS